MSSIHSIILHHTVSPQGTTALQVNDWHKARGMSGIAYHALVRRARGGDWVVEDGRDDEQQGAHAKGANRGSLGVALAGDYSDAEPEPAAYGLLVGQCVVWCLEHGLTPEDIHPHRDVGTTKTACPGLIDVRKVRRAVRGALAAFAPT